MKNIFPTLILLLFIIGNSFSQQMLVKGNVIDTLNNDNPIENVVVMVLSLSDSVLLGFDRTDFNGEFSISGIPVDTVEIIMSHHNFDDKVIFFMGSNANNELNLINTILPDKSEMINEVTIYANKEPIYFRGDTLVYVADSFKTKQNAVVEDLLKKLPGIDVDKNGTITSQGLAVNKILVDGDEFFGDDPTVATKNLGAKTVESVNIYEEENKDESETAEETIQVMDLRLKEGSKKGYFGKISGASDFQNFYEGEFLANRFKNDFKLSVFALGTNTPRSNFGFADTKKFGLSNESNFGGRWWENNNSTTQSGIPRTFRSGFYFSDKLSKKVKLGANYTYSNNEMNSVSDLSSQYFLPDTTYYTSDLGDAYQKSEKHSLNLKLNIKLDSLTELEIKPKYTNSSGLSTQNDSTRFINEEGYLSSYTRNFNLNSGESQTISNELLLIRKFKKEKRELSVTIKNSYSESKDTTDLYFLDNYENAAALNDTLDQKQFGNQINQNHSGLISFKEPLSKRWTAVIDYYSRYNSNQQQKETNDFNASTNEYTLLNNNLTNDFTTNRFTNRLGLFFNLKFFKHRLKVGAYQRNVSIDNIDINDSTVKQNIFNFLPQFNYNYKFSNSQRLRLSYKTNSAQPSINQLQPVQDNTNPNRITIGNSELIPTYSHNFSIRYNKWKALTGSYVYTGANYNITQNAFSSSVEYDDFGKTISQTVNIDQNSSANVYLGAGIPLYESILSLNPNLNSNYTNTTNFVNNNENITNTLNVSGELEFEIETDSLELYLGGSYSYYSPSSTLAISSNQPYYAQEYFIEFGIDLPFKLRIETEASYEIQSYPQSLDRNINLLIWDFEISKRFLKTENLIFSVSGNDILNQNIIAQRIINDNVIIDNRTTIISRYFLARLTYKFNNTKTKEKDVSFH
ncbi:MAG: outer membrane beta-barrel protein [Flavobacteriales bacterium]|nr:outer membrane beta-barrel protein [Flavobacteriales bacterium]